MPDTMVRTSERAAASLSRVFRAVLSVFTCPVMAVSAVCARTVAFAKAAAASAWLRGSEPPTVVGAITTPAMSFAADSAGTGAAWTSRVAALLEAHGL